MSDKSERQGARGTDLLALLLLAFVPRLMRVSAPFDTFGEWGHAQFALYGYNYLHYGFLKLNLMPAFGVVGDQWQLYHHHPMLTPVLLGIWYSIFGPTELATHSLAIIFSLSTLAATYLVAARLWNRKVACWAGLVYALSPNSIYVGRVYCMEIMHIAFLLWGIYFCLCWAEEKEGWKNLCWSALFFVLAGATEVYGVFLTPYFLWMGYRENDRLRKGFWILATVPLLTQGLFMLYLSLLDMGDAAWSSGAGRYARPWLQWFNPNFYKDKGWVILRFYGFVPPVLAVLGSIYGVWKKRSEFLGYRAKWLGLIFWQPLLYAVVGAEMLARHNYVVIFFAVPTALLSGWALSRLPNIAAALLAVGFLWATFLITPTLFKPLYDSDIRAAKKLSTQLDERDLLLGLPPYLGFYLRHEAMVPYYKFWASPGQLSSPDDLYRRIQSFVKRGSFDRVILFQKFVRDPNHLTFPVDLSQSLNGMDEFQLATPPDGDPLVWKRVESPPF